MNIYSILSVAATVLSFLSFLGIVAWAYSSRRRAAFAEAANAPFALPGRERRSDRHRCGAAVMSDFTSDFWNWYVIVATIASIGYCAWLLWQTSKAKVKPGQPAYRPPRVRRESRSKRSATRGTAISPSTTTRCRGGGCGCSGSPSCSRSSISSSIPDWARFQGVLGWTSTSAYAKETAEIDAQDQAALRQVPGDGPQRGRRRSAGPGDGRAALPQLLRAVPRLRRSRPPRLPQSHRHRLALWRRPGDRSSSRSPTAAWASCRRSGPGLGEEKA